jgi:hypothetical protein
MRCMRRAFERRFVLVAVPLFDSEDQFAGAVIGGIDLHSTSITKPIQKLTIGKDGFTYLVDREES